MILFFNKKTGEIIGTVSGRIHSEEHLKMWIGDKDKTERIIVNWKPYQYFDEKGKKVEKSKLKKDKTYNVDFEPDCLQKEIFIELDKKPSDIYKYKVDIKTKQLIPK